MIHLISATKSVTMSHNNNYELYYYIIILLWVILLVKILYYTIMSQTISYNIISYYDS